MSIKTDYSIIGRARNADNINKLASAIRNKGYTCYNFLDQPIVPGKEHLSEQEQMEILESHPDFWNDPLHQHHFDKDLDGLRNADTIILLLPAGKAAHMEAGVAFGLEKKLILIGEVEKPETLYLMFDAYYPNVEAFLETL